jgi:hypothetical protein
MPVAGNSRDVLDLEPIFYVTPCGSGCKILLKNKRKGVEERRRERRKF